ncbi:hypothetical protein A2797_01365 [candidate division WWE3 bacterium RIFCSPHIGHO2_01_FULL_48_15]|uniref:SpaA-like prealbumin fold domain-containing protein n=1 Tax=candidate division WWE3 bacterium RIFCSPHIGHO2_01_FULL_48_15 TaxID=1802619 RepID=A0A1F4VGD4_UNCKA|nr:MAG: hypothetical protein A2797_01365 [candidate division WWE3 bacterium RIFCSPHIGHO2_01_FULL_48_15]
MDKKLRKQTSILVIFSLLFNSFFGTVFPNLVFAEDPPTELFFDGFESGNLGNWSTTASTKWKTVKKTDNAHNGEYRAEVKDTDSAEDTLLREQETTGYQSITLTYWYKIDQNLETNDYIRVYWSEDGGATWNSPPLAEYTGPSQDDYIQETLNLPDAANDNPNFQFKFAAKLDASSDVFWLDDVSLTGDPMPTLTVTKVVVNDDDGAMEVSDFPLFVDDTEVISGETNTFPAGSHVVGETSDEGYTSTISGDCDSEGNVTLQSGDNKACTITNDDIEPQATLTVIKNVINDDNGTKVAGDFTLRVTDGDTDVIDSPFAGSEEGIVFSLDAGTYVISEDALSGYTQAGFSGDCDAEGNITLESEDEKTCTITNDDNEPLDTTGPVSTFDTEMVNLNLTSVPLTISGQTIDDLSGVDSVTVSVYRVGDAGATDLNCSTAIGDVPTEIISLSLQSVLSIDWSETWTPTSSGSYCLKAHALDHVGNAGTAFNGPVSFVQPAPQTSNQTPQQENTSTQSGNVLGTSTTTTASTAIQKTNKTPKPTSSVLGTEQSYDTSSEPASLPAGNSQAKEEPTDKKQEEEPTVWNNIVSFVSRIAEAVKNTLNWLISLFFS